MPAEITETLKCGECGSTTFNIVHRRTEGAVRAGGGPTLEGTLRIVCTKCQDGTTVAPAPSAMVLDGNLCGGWR